MHFTSCDWTTTLQGATVAVWLSTKTTCASGTTLAARAAISYFILKLVLVIKAKLSPFCSYIALRLWPESVAAFHKVRIHHREPNHP